MKQTAIFGALLVILIFGYVVDKRIVRKETIQAMDSLYEAKKKIINYDSLRKNILDSVAPITRGQNWKIRSLQWQMRIIKAKLDSAWQQR